MGNRRSKQILWRPIGILFFNGIFLFNQLGLAVDNENPLIYDDPAKNSSALPAGRSPSHKNPVAELLHPGSKPVDGTTELPSSPIQPDSPLNVKDSVTQEIEKIKKDTPTTSSSVANQFRVIFVAGSRFDFVKTEKAYGVLKTKSDSHLGISCSEGSLDRFSTNGADMSSSDSSGVGISSALQAGANSSAAGAGAFQASCQAENTELLKEAEKVQSVLIEERTACLQAGGLDAKRYCDYTKAIDAGLCYNQKSTMNSNKCYDLALAIKEKDNMLMSSLKDHWGKMLTLLGVLGAGLYALTSSGDKQKNDFSTNPTTTTDKANEKEKTSVTDSSVSPTNSHSPQATNTAQTSNTASYCKSDLQPLECFITPACDLKCVADKYGVGTYSDMSKNKLRINKDGKAVDPSVVAAAAANTPAKMGSGSGSGGKAGVAELSANGESGSSNLAVTKGSVVNDYDDFGGYGGGDGISDSSSDRDPAGERYKNQGVFGDKASAAAAAKGPVLPSTSDLFERVWKTTRTQCVRDLVLCNGK